MKISSSGLKRWVLTALALAAGGVLLAATALALLVWYYGRELPNFNSLADYRPPQVSRMYDRRGRTVAEFYEEKRTVVSTEQMPLRLRQAFLAAEDAEFYRHPGLDFSGMLRALFANFLAGRVVQGGSTITQQIIKTMVLGPERSLRRKIREVLLALRLEKNLSKDDILTIYLNQIYLGHGNYGVQEASRYYFGREVGQLSLPQMALLAALPKSPTRYSPLRNPDRARRRRNWVLDQMAANQFVTREEAESAKQAALGLEPQDLKLLNAAAYYTEHCRRLLEQKLGSQSLLRDGWRIELAMDADVQLAAQEAIKKGLEAIDRRRGYRGPLGRIRVEELEQMRQRLLSEKGDFFGMVWSFEQTGEGEAGGFIPRWRGPLQTGLRISVPVKSAGQGEGRDGLLLDLGTVDGRIEPEQLKWIENSGKSWRDWFSPGDLVRVEVRQSGDPVLLELVQEPQVQGALVAIEPRSRQVLALVGGYDFSASSFIRAIQARRQPGSAFKPVVFAAAVHSGKYTPASIVMDTPEVLRLDGRGKSWQPQNFEREFTGGMTLRQALAHSVNTVAVKLALDVGLDKVQLMARRLGITSEISANPSIALGAVEVSPLELTNAYAVFAAGGEWREAVFINHIQDTRGTEIILEKAPAQQVLSPAEAYIMTWLLEAVIEEGTAKKARSLKRPLAGKTGTTSSYKDAWFVGYSAELVAGVWVGLDDQRQIGGSWAQGAGAALPIWMSFIERVLRETPARSFPVPPEVVFVRVDPASGKSANGPGSVLQAFVAGSEPAEQAETTDIRKQGGSQQQAPLPEEMFR